METFTGSNLSSAHQFILLSFLPSLFFRDISGGGAENSPTHGYVNELYCILEPNIPLENVTAQCKSLALQLWQNTKQALAPFPLIN